MNYAESLAYLESLTPTILNPDLTRFRLFMSQIGNIQDKCPSIHIAGTNGKGSTVAIVDSVLRAAGLKTGRYTGPHLLRWNERFHVGGKPIDDHKFAEIATTVRRQSESFAVQHPELGCLTWFEFLTAIAFIWFSECNVDVIVVEVGLGGRWDATNVLTRPLVSAITTIDFDHMHILGPTLAAIASEKAGIIKAEVPVVTSASGEALPVIVDRANSLGAPLYVVSAEPKFHVEKINDLLNMNLDFGNFTDVITAQSNSLAANYQQINALVSYVVLAIAEKQLTGKILQSFSLGAEKVYWPGRFQYIGGRNLLLDGAHNPGGTLALRRALDLEFEKRPRLFVLSFFENKNVLGALQALLRPGDRVYVSEAQTTRAVCKADSLATWARALGAEAEVADSIAGALQLAESVRSGDDLIVATGSFETVKACMLALGWNSVEDGLTVTTKLH